MFCEGDAVKNSVRALVLFCFILGTFAAGKNSNILEYNSLRLAYYLHGEELATGLANGYLERAARAQYNYLIAEFHLDSDESNPGISAKKEEFRKAFLLAHEHGMRMIPKIQLGSKWSLHWTATNNPHIQMNRYHDGQRIWGCPSFAYDPDGIDASFEELLTVIREAFIEANLPYDLEFIDLGHDEPVDDGYLLIGGVPDSVAGPEDSFAQIDREFILDRVNNHGDDVSTAFQTLVVNELFRRVGQVQRILGPETRILVYGDLWDPEANGGIEKRTFLTKEEEICYDHAARKVACDSDEMDRRAIEMVIQHSQMTPGIGSLPGLTDDQKTIFRNGVILRPWCYYDAWPFGGDPDGDGKYNAEASFSYLAKHGFKFVFTSVHHEKPSDKAYTEGELRAMTKYVKASRLFRDSCYGYAAAPWEARWQDPPDTLEIFDTLEELYELNRGYIPKSSFRERE
jgi:hypothetical protein